MTACSSSGSGTKADPVACKAAMRKQLQGAIAAGDKATPGTRSAPCEDVDSKTLQKIAADLMTDELGKSVDATAANLTPDCHAWLKKALRDPSTNPTPMPGYNPCAYLSEKGLNKAIDAVTAELVSGKSTP